MKASEKIKKADYTYDINTSKKDKKSTICLSVCHLISEISNIFLSTFLIAHIYSLTSNIYEYAKNVALYQFFTYLTMFVTYFIFSYFVDKTNRIWIYRLAVVFKTIFIIVAIFYGEDLAKIIILAGFLHGISHAAYYSSYNVLKQEMVSRKSIGNFTVIIKICAKSISVIFPIILGALIEISTFSLVAVYVFILSVIQLIISLFIKAKKPKNSSYQLLEYLKKLKTNPSVKNKFGSIYILALFYGFITAISALLSINIMMEFGSNFSLGAMTSIFALVSVMGLLLMNKFTKRGKRSWLYITASISLIASAILFACITNITTLIIYNFCFVLSEIVLGINFEVYRNQNIKEAGLYDDIAEHQTITECCMQIARMISFGILFIVSLIGNHFVFQFAFIIFILLFTIMAPILIKYEKQNSNQDSVKNQ
ncbi:MAG: MFS transporter [Clostridia bacterium]|nr:MFS transporter [Clostridia bacterium]